MVLTDNDLMFFHLVPKCREPTAKHGIQEADVYNSHPWDLMKNAKKDADFCFFTKKTRTRCNNVGYWVSCSDFETVTLFGEEQRMATKRDYRFHYMNGTATCWFLTEFVLDDKFRAQVQLPADGVEYVLCILYESDEEPQS